MKKLRLRWLARIIAFVGGYFWLRCPICGKFFAGFECGNARVATEKPEIYYAACSDHDHEGEPNG